MGIYSLITAVLLPTLLNSVLNVCIFIHVRKSSHRIRPQTITVVTNGIHNQQMRISRRDIALWKGMIFTFTIFIIGWTPAFIMNMIRMIQPVDFMTSIVLVYLSEICLLSLIINLLKCDYEIRRVLFDAIRHRLHC